MSLDEGRQNRVGMVRSAHTLQEKNLMLLAAAADIFSLHKPWDKVKSGMSDARIREFYAFIAGLWPTDTDYLSLLPKPDGTLRALYLGENDPEMMLENVFRFSLYADHIIVMNPFDNPNVMAEQFNPVRKPGEWRIQTLRLIYHLRILAPWITAGLVTLIPDPGDFDFKLRRSTWDLAQKRLGTNFLSDEDIDSSIERRKVHDIFYMSPPDYVARMAKQSIPEITDKEVADLVAYMEKARVDNPLLLNQTLDKMPDQLTAVRVGANLEMGLFLCQTMGAFPYTNVKFRWREILSAADKLDPSAQTWSPLTNAFGNLNFKFLNNVDSNFAVTMRKEGRLGGFRSYIRKLWDTVDGNPDPSRIDMLAREFKDELEGEYSKVEAEWSEIDRDLMKWAIPAIGGVISSVGAILTGHYSLAVPGGGFGLGGVNELIQAHMKRTAFRKKTPLSVFIDLNKK